jgi:hypothetical protein
MTPTPPRWHAPDDEQPDPDFEPSVYFTPGTPEWEQAQNRPADQDEHDSRQETR